MEVNDRSLSRATRATVGVKSSATPAPPAPRAAPPRPDVGTGSGRSPAKRPAHVRHSRRTLHPPQDLADGPAFVEARTCGLRRVRRFLGYGGDGSAIGKASTRTRTRTRHFNTPRIDELSNWPIIRDDYRAHFASQRTWGQNRGTDRLVYEHLRWHVPWLRGLELCLLLRPAIYPPNLPRAAICTAPAASLAASAGWGWRGHATPEQNWAPSRRLTVRDDEAAQVSSKALRRMSHTGYCAHTGSIVQTGDPSARAVTRRKVKPTAAGSLLKLEEASVLGN